MSSRELDELAASRQKISPAAVARESQSRQHVLPNLTFQDQVAGRPRQLQCLLEGSGRCVEVTSISEYWSLE